jgi:sec-independent protein translocase protein TatA
LKSRPASAASTRLFPPVVRPEKKGAIMSLGPTELIIVLLIVIVLFGVGRISKIGKELGSGIREFRQGLSDESEKKDEPKSDQ